MCICCPVTMDLNFHVAVITDLPVGVPGPVVCVLKPPVPGAPGGETTSRAAPAGLPSRRGGPEEAALRRAATPGVTPLALHVKTCVWKPARV